MIVYSIWTRPTASGSGASAPVYVTPRGVDTDPVASMSVQGLAPGSIPFPSSTSNPMIGSTGLTFSIPTPVSSDSVAALAAQASLIAAQLREIEARAALAALHSMPSQSVAAGSTSAPAAACDNKEAAAVAAGGYASVLGGPTTEKGRAAGKGSAKGAAVPPEGAGSAGQIGGKSAVSTMMAGQLMSPSAATAAAAAVAAAVAAESGVPVAAEGGTGGSGGLSRIWYEEADLHFDLVEDLGKNEVIQEADEKIATWLFLEVIFSRK